MISAYPEIYLSKAQSVLGEAFDYAVNTCRIDGKSFTDMFTVSSVSRRIENGDTAYIAGNSGTDILQEILLETTGQDPEIIVEKHYDRSEEYWIGWAVAYYQWYSGRKFSEIFEALPFESLRKIYYPLHEADISKFVDMADSRMKEHFPETRLKRIRTLYGLTQAELAEISGVSLRSIQMYEQRNKNINKASAETLYRLARILGCTMEDLLEKQEM